MNRLALSALLFAALFAGVVLGSQCTARPPAACVPTAQAINALFEQDMRGEISLSASAIATLHDVEALACQEVPR